jgi:hypothetical protein
VNQLRLALIQQKETVVRSGKPERYVAVESSDKVRRKVFCRHYGDCLDYTIRKKWPGFSCQGCLSYEQERLEGRALDDDYARCMALAFASGAIELGQEIA